MRSQLPFTATVLAFSGLALAQTSTDCNPLTNTTCPSDTALGKTITVDFTEGANSEFSAADGTTITYTDSGAEFIMTSDGLASTINSENYIFFGKVEVVMKAANGTGVVSSFVMESDDLDEIDWEWLGGNSTVVETNYFGKGNTTTYDRATWVACNNPQTEWHTYTIDWTSAYVKWYVDSVLIRTLLYADALDGKNFPQTPMRIKVGIWDAGAADEAEGTVEWAQGYTDLSEAPFVMTVKSITIEDYTTSGTEYTYGDETGDYTSIIIGTSNSTSSSSTSSNSTNSDGSSSSSSSTSTSYSAGSSVGTSNSTNATTTKSSSSANSSASSISTSDSMIRETSGVLSLVLSLALGYFI